MSWFSDVVDSFSRSDIGRALPRPSTLFLNPAQGAALDVSAESRPKGKGLRAQMQASHEQSMIGSFTELRERIKKSDINPYVKEQLFSMQGADKAAYDRLEAEFARATRGEGSYGALNRNYKALMFAKDRPGALQLFGNTQARASAGSGILSTQPNPLLTPGNKK